MASAILREERPTLQHPLLGARLHASIQRRTNQYSWEDAAQRASEGHEKPYSRHKLAKGSGKRLAGGFRSGIYWVLLSVLIPALIVSVLRILCKPSASVSRGLDRGTSTRRLSDSGDSNHEESTLSQILEECAAMEADLGQAVLQRSNSHHALDAAEEVERIAFDLYQEAVAFESQLQQAKSAGQPIFPSLPPSPASYGVNFHHGDLERAAHRVDEQPPSLIHQRLTSGPTTAELQPTGRLPELFASSAQPLGGASQAILSRPPILLAAPSRFSWPHQGSFASLESSVAPHLSAVGTDPTAAAGYSVGLLPPNAGLLPQDAGRRRSGLKRRVERSKGKHPELDPDSWLDAPVGTDMSPEGQGQSQSSSPRKRSSNLPAPVSLAASHVPAGDAKQRAASQSSSKASASGAGEAPAAASRPETAAAVQADWVCKHPYVHLPVLAEGVVPPLIQLSASNFEQSKGSSVRDILLPFRFLLKKQALSQIDSNFLVGYVQELASASAARARATKRMRRALHGVVTIGLQFLVLDAIVSALHVLGVSPPSCSWWKAFTECFDTDYRYPEPRVRQQDSARVNIDLANRMLTAMSTYKEGIRPNIEEVIDIKRILFFSPHAPLRFRSPNWDPWRTDHLLFEEANPQFFDWLFKVRKSRH